MPLPVKLRYGEREVTLDENEMIELRGMQADRDAANQTYRERWLWLFNRAWKRRNPTAITPFEGDLLDEQKRHIDSQAIRRA